MEQVRFFNYVLEPKRTAFPRERRQGRENAKKNAKARNAIPYRRAETKSTLIRYKRVPYVSYAPVLSLSLRYSRSERAHERTLPREYRERRATAVIVIRYRPRVINEVRCLARGRAATGGCRFHRRETNAIPRVSPRSEESSRIQFE